ncbi:hypothetical protein [Thauera sp. SDU_THAU2]|uniref:hypothetical protein n=1 Tax=Thauera sp. SDU_THAU2 TaxID=3136633 RepID=UPI00311D70C2
MVIMGLDREITHEKLRIAVDAVLKGAVLIGTNPDLLLPMPTGFEPAGDRRRRVRRLRRPVGLRQVHAPAL